MVLSFVFANMKMLWKSANQNKNNFRFATLTKHVNNQTNSQWYIALNRGGIKCIGLVFI